MTSPPTSVPSPLLGALLAACVALGSASAETAESAASDTPATPDRPNIVFIIADDLERHMLNALPEGRGSPRLHR